MSKRKWYTKAIYLGVALAMTVGLLMVPAAVASPPDSEVAASPAIGVAWISCHELNSDVDDFGSVTMTDAEAKYGDWSAKLTADGPAGTFGDYGKLIVDVCPLAFADLAEFSFWVEGGAAAAQDLPLHEIELAAISEDVTLPTGSNVLGDAPPDIAAWNTIGATLSATTNRVSIAYQPGDAGKKTNATAGFEKFGTHADAAIDASDEAWAIFWDSDGDTVFDKSAGYYTWAEIHSAFDGKATVGDVRVELRWPPGGDTTVWVDDVVIDDTRYPIEPDLIPEIAYDVKGSEQKFFVNCCCLDEPWTPGSLPSDVFADVTWDVTPGLNLHSVGLPGQGKDITVEQGGKYGIGGGIVNTDRDNYIGISATQPGDCSVSVTITGGKGEYTYTSEKKWGVIDHTILDLDVVTAGQQLDVVHDAGAAGDPETEKFSDTVYASFLKSEGTFTTTAGHAIVHWWLIVDDALGLNEAAIDAIMTDLGPDGCGDYADLYAATGESPKDLIDAVWTADPADYTTFTEVQEGITDLDLVDDPNIDTTFNVLGLTYIKTMTEDDFPCQTRGLVEVETSNTGAEDILVVTYTEYPHDYHGENPVCVEKGRKTWGPVPPPAEVKTPQVRWAGEKIILEKDWSDEIIGDRNYVAIYHMDEASVGTLYFGGDNDASELAGGDIWVWVHTTNPTSEVILESQLQGEADVEVALYEYTAYTGMNVEALFDSDEPLDSATAQIVIDSVPLVNTGFMVYYLAFEDVTLAEDITPAASLTKALPGLCMDVDVAVQVRGWFTSDALPGTDREAVDLDGDGVYELPAGRYVLPDDWAAMAGNNYELRPNWDLMDQADNDTINSIAELGPYDILVATTDPPGEAEAPSIGPFSTLQPWTTVELWNASAVVPSSHADGVRNTVVPDGSLDAYDCPMPQALVIFDVVAQVVIPPDTGTLSGLDKGDLEGYGYAVDVSGTATGGTTTTLVDTAQAWTAGLLIGRTVVIVKDCTTYERIITANTATSFTFAPALTSAVAAGDTYYLKVYQSPFYEVEIPSSSFIPSAGYNWASWGVDLGPYDYWDDLHILSINADTTEDPVAPTLQDIQDVEVYCDNHGIAGVTIDAPIQTGTVTITATAEFPNSLKKGKYGPMTSDEITATWGPIELNPHFTADKTDVDVDETVTFDNLTTGGTHPYTLAEWDFNNDGTIDLTLTGTEAAVMASVGTAYAADGVYSVTLHMTDSTPTTRYETRDDYITVGTGGVPPVTWNLANGVDVAPPWINIWTYPASAATVTLLDVDTTMPDGLLIWSEDLKFYKKGWGVSNTLTTMVPGDGYIGIVPTASLWEIPQA